MIWTDILWGFPHLANIPLPDAVLPLGLTTDRDNSHYYFPHFSFKEGQVNSFMKSRSVRKMKIMSSEISLTILYDNITADNDLQAGWGFSCLVEGAGETILFDTGARGDVLLSNMKKLGISPRDIDIVVLSHFHGDHTGGIDALLEQNHEISVYFPSSFARGFLERILASGAGLVPVSSCLQIMPGVSVTPETGDMTREIAMVIETDRGLIVMTGCAHPGVKSILEKVECISPDKLLMIIGGLHLEARSRFEIELLASTLAKKGLSHPAPCHCSGDLSKEVFRNQFPGYIETGVGRKIRLKDIQSELPLG